MPDQTNSLNEYHQPLDAPVAQQGTHPQKQIPWKYGINQQFKARRLKASFLDVRSLGTYSNTASLISTIGAGSTQFITDTLTPQSPHGTEMNFAVPYVAVYEGTAAIPNHQIYPLLGGSQAWGSYSFQADNDWNTWATISPGSVISAFNMTIHNNMGVAGTYFFVSQFKYLNYNSGTVT